MVKNKLRRIIARSAAFALVLVFTAASLASSVQAATVTINSPVNGQQFNGNSFTVSGQTDSNATVLIMRNNQLLQYTRADNSGAWSANLSNLPDGNNTITAKILKSSGYGYYVSTPDLTQVKLNRFQLSDNTATIDDTYPMALTKTNIGIVPAPVGSKLILTADIGNSAAPDIFDSANPTAPVEVDDYPANAGTNFGGFSLDGSKYFSPNDNLHTVSVVDVANHVVTANIDLGENPITAWTSPQGLVYVTSKASGQIPKISIIDPSTNTIATSFNAACSLTDSATSFTFAADSGYPYFYTYCLGSSQKILKYKIADHSLVAEFTTTDFSPTSGALSIDGSKLYTSMSALAIDDPEHEPTTHQIHVYDTDTGADTKTITASGGIIGFYGSPDLQRLYVATPSGDFSSQGFDVLDTFTDEITHSAANGEIIPVIGVPPANLQTANVNVSVVLGVKTTAAAGGSLADTGAVAVSTTLLLGLIIGSLSYTYYDYRKHKKPLVEADPSAQTSYTYVHHLQTVSIPLLKYRLSFSVHRADEGSIRKF